MARNSKRLREKEIDQLDIKTVGGKPEQHNCLHRRRSANGRFVRRAKTRKTDSLDRRSPRAQAPLIDEEELITNLAKSFVLRDGAQGHAGAYRSSRQGRVAAAARTGWGLRARFPGHAETSGVGETAVKLSADTGLAYRPAAEGEHVSGVIGSG